MKTKTEIEVYFFRHPTMSPQMAFFNLFTQKMQDGASKEEIDQLLLAQVNSWTMLNAKAAARRKLNPSKNTIDILRKLKADYVDKKEVEDYGVIMDIYSESEYCLNCKEIVIDKEDFLSGLCPKCNSRLIDTNEFVPVTSEACLQTMHDMSDGQPLFSSSCRLDHQPGRTKEFTTFEGVVYDPDLRDIVNVFTFHMKHETSYHVAAAFSYLSKLMKTKSLLFKPIGFVSDEGGGLLGGIREQFGEEFPINTDDFHFKQNCFQLVS